MQDEIALQVKHLNKSFDKKQILHDVSLDVHKAKILGLLGPSGSGKTTLVKLMAGIDSPDSGEVFILGEKVPNLKMLNRIGYMAQADALYGELTAEENLEFFASMYGLRKSEKKNRIEEVMKIVNLYDYLKIQVKKYSGGMKRRLSLAIALLHKPPILVLDEPTVGIDPVLRISIWEELYELCRNGTTIIVTTHVMDEAEKCHELGMIREGRLIALGTPEEILKASDSETIEEAFLFYGGVKR
ncbi:MAG: ABC-type multidrug transport system, ATPase component [Firmicutes bacterium]|nr:ABC-type multidrug transport system, ATPase component [Bacillota bacterium]